MLPTNVPRSDTDRAANSWLRTLARTGGRTGRIALVLPLVAGTVLLVQAYVLAGILHRAIIEAAPVADLLPQILGLAALIATRVALGIVAEIAAVASGESVKFRLRTALVGNLLGRKPVWTAARPSGALSGLVVEQVDALEGYLVRYLPAMVQAAVLPIAFAVVLLPVDWVVGLLFLVTAPVIPVFMALAGWGAEAASRAQANALARLSGRFADRLRGLVTLKLFGRADAEVASVHQSSEELRRRTMGVMRIAFLSSAVLEFFAALGVAGVALYVGLTFLDLVSLRGDPLTLQAGLFCLLMAPEVYQPLRLLAAHYHDRASAKAAAAEIAATLGELPVTGGGQAEALMTNEPLPKRGAAALELRRVDVATPAGRAVIGGVSLSFAPGSLTAILGPSGSGKSTLIEAIAGLREHHGIILLDGTPIDRIAESQLRGRIAFLGQRPRVFAGTIAENIRLGRSDACDTAIRVAARRARVLDFADDLSDGLETLLGENGLGLSGGEIQRVALARIYLRDPGLIILDEPTAHLDPATEDSVLEGLIEFAAGRTLIVATHAPAVAAHMDDAWRIAAGELLPALKPRSRAPDRSRGAA